MEKTITRLEDGTTVVKVITDKKFKKPETLADKLKKMINTNLSCIVK